MFSLQNLQQSGKKQEFHKNTEELDETSSEDDSDDSERQGKESFVFKRLVRKRLLHTGHRPDICSATHFLVFS